MGRGAAVSTANFCTRSLGRPATTQSGESLFCRGLSPIAPQAALIWIKFFSLCHLFKAVRAGDSDLAPAERLAQFLQTIGMVGHGKKLRPAAFRRARPSSAPHRQRLRRECRLRPCGGSRQGGLEARSTTRPRRRSSPDHDRQIDELVAASRRPWRLTMAGRRSGPLSDRFAHEMPDGAPQVDSILPAENITSYPPRDHARSASSGRLPDEPHRDCATFLADRRAIGETERSNVRRKCSRYSAGTAPR